MNLSNTYRKNNYNFYASVLFSFLIEINKNKKIISSSKSHYPKKWNVYEFDLARKPVSSLNKMKRK